MRPLSSWSTLLIAACALATSLALLPRFCLTSPPGIPAGLVGFNSTHLCGYGFFSPSREPRAEADARPSAIRQTEPRARKERIAVIAGTDWSTQARQAKPGDEIVLMPGLHRPATLEGLRGTQESPIVVTSSASDLLAEISTEDVALRLVDCHHVRVQRIVVRDAPEAAVAIEAGADGGCREIEIDSLLAIRTKPRPSPAAGTKAHPPQHGVLVRGADGVRITRSRIDGAADAGVLVERSRRVRLDELQVVSRASIPMRIGIALGDAAEDVEVTRATVAGRVGSGLALGPVDSGAPAASSSDPAPPALASRNVRVADCNVRDADRAIELGSCDGVDVRRLSAIEPKVEVVRIAPDVGGSARAVRIESCAFVWSPGRLRRLVGGAPPADPAGVELGENLWFSKELPLALPALGPVDNPFIMRIVAPQRTDLDPRLDDLGRSENPEASQFGRRREPAGAPAGANRG